MESNYSKKINSTHAEVEQANEKIDSLLTGMQQLETLNNEKDEKIVNLETDLAKIEIETKKKNEEISRLSKEVELLRKSRSASATPILNSCTGKQKTCNLKAKSKGRNRRSIIVKTETKAATPTELLASENTGKKKESSALEVNTEKVILNQIWLMGFLD